MENSGGKERNHGKVYWRLGREFINYLHISQLSGWNFSPKLQIGKDSRFSFCFTCQQNTYVCKNKSKKITLMKNLKNLSEIDNLGSLWTLAKCSESVFGIIKLTGIGKAHRRIFSNMTNQRCFIEKVISGDWEWKITLKEFFFHACCSTIQVFS